MLNVLISNKTASLRDIHDYINEPDNTKKFVFAPIKNNNIPRTSIYRILNQLEEKGLVLKEKKEDDVFYSLNQNTVKCYNGSGMATIVLNDRWIVANCKFKYDKFGREICKSCAKPTPDNCPLFKLAQTFD